MLWTNVCFDEWDITYLIVQQSFLNQILDSLPFPLLSPINKKIPGSAPEGDLMLDIGSGNEKMVFVLLCGNHYTALETAY